MHAHALPDAADIAAGLARHVESLARELLPAGRRKGGYWTVGGLDNAPGGSLAIHLHGSRAGKWTDYATGEFGDALDLVAQVMFRGDKSQAWRWGCAYLGHSGAQIPASTPAARAAPDPAATADDDGRRRAALRIYLEARPALAGTPAARYLAGRGLDLADLGRQPRCLRFHPRLRHGPSGRVFPALIAAVSGADGAHVATHRTFLDGAGDAWGKARVESPKMSLGAVAGGAIRLWRGASGKPLRDAAEDEEIVIGEGIETCLSIAIACPELRVLAAVSLANLGRVALPPQISRVILAADNDGAEPPRRALQRAVEQHMDAGRTVRVARSPIGKDFNDALRAWG